MIGAVLSSVVLAVVAGAWALLEARDAGIEGDGGSCGPGCSCRRSPAADDPDSPRPPTR